MAALTVVPFYPVAAVGAIALVCGALGFFAPSVGVLAFVLALAVPMVAGDPVIGVAFLLVGIGSASYLGDRGGRAFLIVTLAFAASVFHAEWAMAPLAGYVMGSTDGALTAFLAVGALEVAGIIFGHPSAGVLATGGTKPMIDLVRLRALPSPLSFGWLTPAIQSIDSTRDLKLIFGAHSAPLLVVQPVLWAATAAIVGTFRRFGAPLRSLGIAVAGALVLGVASMSAMAAMHGPLPAGTLGAALPAAAVLTALVVALAEWAFPIIPVAAESGLSSMKAEDADVDDLLRMIASAEEALEDRHATDATVMITDMKSFSKMTQERGTVATAKVIQQQRDLLLPVVSRTGGHGKSTGGDGLVAAFASPDEALRGAVEMQRALDTFNARRAEDERVEVRIGLAQGDVILDRAGCPFIGDALNLAARVMSLADGGQVFAAGDVVDGAAELPSPAVSHGEFALKNIARPVIVCEVLWSEGQEPKRPEAPATVA